MICKFCCFTITFWTLSRSMFYFRLFSILTHHTQKGHYGQKQSPHLETNKELIAFIDLKRASWRSTSPTDGRTWTMSHLQSVPNGIAQQTGILMHLQRSLNLEQRRKHTQDTKKHPNTYTAQPIETFIVYFTLDSRLTIFCITSSKRN